MYQFVPATAGQTYRTQAWIYHASAYALTSGCSLWIKLEFKNAAGTILTSNSLQVGGTNTGKDVWRLVAGPQATAPAGTVTAGIVLVFMQNNATDTGAGFWDDAVLERVEAGPISYDLADRG